MFALKILGRYEEKTLERRPKPLVICRFFRGLYCRVIWMFPKIVVPPNHPILIGFSIINHPFWGTPIFGNIHIGIVIGQYIWIPMNSPMSSAFQSFGPVFRSFKCSLDCTYCTMRSAFASCTRKRKNCRKRLHGNRRTNLIALQTQIFS